MKRVYAVSAIFWFAVAAAQAAELEIVNPRALFPEGPVMWQGKLLYAEYAGQVVRGWDGKDNAEIWRQEGCGPSAVVPVTGGFAVTCYDSGQIVIISAEGETLRTYDKDDAGAALAGPNDGTPDGEGGAWITLSGPWESAPIVGRIVHLTKDGMLKAAADDLHYANGIVAGADGRLYVNESEAGRVISFAVGADGSLSDRRLFVRLQALGGTPDAYPDGIKRGPNGNFYVGHYNSGTIMEIAPDGSLKNTYDVPSKAAPNLAFSEDGKTMYVMAVDNKDAAPYEGKVYALPVK